MNQDDQHLMQRVAKGDERAFIKLYDRYSPRVYALALRVLNDKMLAEEVAQDSFLKLWGRAKQFNPHKGQLITWLLTICHRTALDRLRLENRRPPASNSAEPDVTWSSLPDEKTESSEARWRSLYFAVQSLPDEQRQVIDLAYYKGMSQSEIAEVLGWPLGTVKTRVRAAMQSLRQHWFQDNTEEI
jgi:RNA polymerase sigma-70 factor, ECF subfamily